MGFKNFFLITFTYVLEDFIKVFYHDRINQLPLNVLKVGYLKVC